MGVYISSADETRRCKAGRSADQTQARAGDKRTNELRNVWNDELVRLLTVGDDDKMGWMSGRTGQRATMGRVLTGAMPIISLSDRV